MCYFGDICQVVNFGFIYVNVPMREALGALEAAIFGKTRRLSQGRIKDIHPNGVPTLAQSDYPLLERAETSNTSR